MNRKDSAFRRAPLNAVLTTVVATIAAACSVASPSASAPSVAPSAGTSASISPATSPSPLASPSPMPSPSEPASPPSSWQSCSNVHQGFEIDYPVGWHTAELNPQQACQQFDPIAFTIPVDSEYPLTALNAVLTQDVFDPDRSGAGDPTVRTLLREEATVDGRRAVRFEQTLIEQGMYPVGTMWYGYAIDRDGLEFRVFTMAVPAGAGDYTDWKMVVDQAVKTLRFD